MNKTRVSVSFVTASIIGLTICLTSNAVFAESIAAKLGEVQYRTNCMVCHGEAGKGDGPMADQLTQKPSNLQLLSKSHNGYFPFDKVYDMIDGRNAIRAHGTSDMPVWGNAFVPDIDMMTGSRDAVKEQVEAAIAGRILSVVYYLQSIQVE